jgi:hypothetical protein
MSSNHFVHFDFPHRMNIDGTIDSICPHCFVTIGCSTWEADLDRMEAAHICEPARLASFNGPTRNSAIVEQVPELDDQPGEAAFALAGVWIHGALISRKSI